MNIQFFNLHNNFSIPKLNSQKYKGITSPLKTLSKDTLEISFGEKYCSVDNFQIKKLKDLRCPVCGKIMLDDEEIEYFVQDISSKKGEKLVKALEKYEDEKVFTKQTTNEKQSIYRPIKQEAVEILKKLAKVYPDKDLSDLFQIRRRYSLEKLVPLQMEILEEYADFATKNAKTQIQKNEINNVINEYTKQAKGLTKEHFSRKKFIYSAIHVFQDKKTQNEVNEIVQKLPNSQNNVDAFFVKQTSKTKDSESLARSLVSQTTSSAEHLEPKSKGGKNKISNYIADCAECNMQRSDAAFDEWIETIPNFEDNLQKYIETIQKAIDDGKLDEDYDTYPTEVIETIKTLSNGKINLKLPETTNPETIKKNLQERKTFVENLKEDINKKQAIKAELKKEIDEAQSLPYLDFAIQHQTITSKMASVEESLKALEIEIKNTESKEKKAKKQAKIVLQARLQDLKTEKETKEKELENLKIEEAQIAAKYPQVYETEKEMSLILNKINSSKRIIEEIDAFDKISIKEESVLKKINELTEKINALKKANNLLEEKTPTIKDDKTDYLEYKHNEVLIKYIISMQTQDNKKKTKYQDEVFDIARITLENRQKELEELDSVVYFSNIHTIKNHQNNINNLKEALEEITKEKDRIKDLIEKYEAISQEGSIEDFEKQHQELKEKRRILLNLEKIVSLRQKYEELEKLCLEKERILLQLENYKTLTNEEFKQITSQID